MNKYLKNLSKIEFVITYACTGRCKHCSEGDHSASGICIDPAFAADAVKRITSKYDIKTVMAFGGEPLLCPEAVYATMSAARESNVEKRQLITNGFFTKDTSKICEVVKRLAECGVNDLLLSVDAFHQETIPLGTVKIFASEAKKLGIPIRSNPAWLVSRDAENSYNTRTREILASLSDIGVTEGIGNVVFPEGNALKYLSEYFADTVPENPYAEDPCDVRCVSFEPNGDVLGANAHNQDIMNILERYEPII